MLFENFKTRLRLSVRRHGSNSLVQMGFAVAVFLISQKLACARFDLLRTVAHQQSTLFQIEIQFTETELIGFNGLDERQMESPSTKEQSNGIWAKTWTNFSPALDDLPSDRRFLVASQGFQCPSLNRESLQTVESVDQGLACLLKATEREHVQGA